MWRKESGAPITQCTTEHAVALPWPSCLAGGVWSSRLELDDGLTTHIRRKYSVKKLKLKQKPRDRNMVTQN